MRSPLWIACLAALAAAPVVASPARAAAKFTINVQNFSFNPRDITVTQGDTVQWVWISGSHTATNGANPGDAGAGTLFNGSLNSTSTQFTHVFNEPPGLIPFHCAPHWFVGMTGTVTVQPGQAPSGVRHDVSVRDFAFDPATVNADPGDTVRWNWVEGSHTTTSGASSNPIHNPGALWSAPVTAASPQVDWVIPGDAAGLFPYFSIPDEAADMRGLIVVGAVTGVPGDGGRTARFAELQPPFPNPTGGSTTLVFSLAAGMDAKLDVFDLAGRRVAAVASGWFDEGYHVFHWNGMADHGHPVSPGIYFVRLKAGEGAATRKIFIAGHDADHAHGGHH